MTLVICDCCANPPALAGGSSESNRFYLNAPQTCLLQLGGRLTTCVKNYLLETR